MHEALVDVAKLGVPILGICLGMQMLLDVSNENGKHSGLGLIPGKVLPIPKLNLAGRQTRRKVPHIGWNELQCPEHCQTWENSCLKATKEGSFVYFVHSYMAEPSNKQHILANCDYEDLTITAAVLKDNIVGVQFHPERSGPTGLKILKEFISM